MGRTFSIVVGLSLQLFAATLSSATEPAAPIALHPDNPRYFSWRGKPTILVTSGEHYGAVLNLDFDYVRYLDELEAHGLNHTRAFSGTYREVPKSFGITDNTLSPRPGRFTCPWARSEQPGESDGGAKFDLRRYDERYFARLKDFMSEAAERGIVVEMTLFCPLYTEELWQVSPLNTKNNVNGVGNCGRGEVFTLAHPDLTDVQLAVTRKIVAELAGFDNLYYEVCNEPYERRTDMKWQHRIVEAIVEAERELPRRHLISMNIANGRAKIDDPHPAVSIFNFHYCVPPDTVALNYHLAKVIGENETGFRGPDDVLYRTEAWDFLLAGGALFNNLDYSFTPGHPDGTLREYRSPGGGSRELRQQLGILKRFLDGFDLVRMRPASEVVASVSESLVASALAESGKAYAIYVHVPLPLKPKQLADHLRQGIRAELSLKLPPGTYAATWVDTQSGRPTEAAPIEHPGGTVKLTSPAFDNDIALRLIRR